MFPKTTFAFLLLLSGMLVGVSLSFNSPSSRRAFLAVATAGTSAILATSSTPAVASASSSSSSKSSTSSTNAMITVGGNIVYGDESIMTPKAHGTSARPVQDQLRYGVSNTLADRICNYNRHWAENSGYFTTTDFETLLVNTVQTTGQPMAFYDSVTGKPLFVAPRGRTVEEFLTESRRHGWPSFRDDETVWANVRVLSNSGEVVSVDGTHLGHNLGDRKGNRYCINLVSVAGQPTTTSTATSSGT